MKCECNNVGTCGACLYYKSSIEIINSIDFLTISDPATFVRNQTNSVFDITEEECIILERMKHTQNDTEYKEYISKSKHYIKIDSKSVIQICCPTCNNKIDISITPVKSDKLDLCCSRLTIEKVHDERCMYYGGYFL
jgi:hypothetical protein